MKYKAIVIGTSTGGLNALKTILPALPADFVLPIIIVQHVGPSSENYWIEMLNNMCKIKVKEADEKEEIRAGNIYLAPANYHLLIELDKTFSLTIDERVNFARPSIDVLFESAANAYKEQLIGVILTGANNDGAKGIMRVKELGGLTIVQDPNTAEASYMPAAAVKSAKVDHILSLEKIVQLLIEINKQS